MIQLNVEYNNERPVEEQRIEPSKPFIARLTKSLKSDPYYSTGYYRTYRYPVDLPKFITTTTYEKLPQDN
jgi:hypothetical protein